MDANAASNYRKRYGLDVKFVLLEDPAAKLAAFRKGAIDIMWDTVDNWAREASILEENGSQGEVDPDAGLVARRRRHRLARVDQVDRGPEGPEDRLHAVHAVALPAALPAGAVGTVARRPGRAREEHHHDAGRAGGRRDVQGAAGGRRGDVGAGPLGGGDGPRRRGAHPRLDDGRDQHHRRHAGRPAGAHRRGARHGARLRAGLVRGDRDDQARPGLVVRAGRARRSSWTPTRCRACCRA